MTFLKALQQVLQSETSRQLLLLSSLVLFIIGSYLVRRLRRMRPMCLHGILDTYDDRHFGLPDSSYHVRSRKSIDVALLLRIH